MKYFLIAGEASGDLLSSLLMKGLYASDPDADIRFWGGPLMDEVFHAHGHGKGLMQDYREGAEMGFSAVLLHAGRYLRRFSRCLRDILEFGPDAVILVDYPGFNLRLAKALHGRGMKVFWYIAPKVWASREGRIRQLKAYLDGLFIIFPFEKDYFASKGVECIYEGNPLVDLRLEDSPAPEGLPEGRYIALLPGSRKAEIGYMMPVMTAFAESMHAKKEYSAWQFIIARAPSIDEDVFVPYLKGREGYLRVVSSRTAGVLRHSALAVVNSGTASLEACLTGTPQVVGYAMSPFNYMIAKKIVRVKYISLGNLILGREAVKELLQKDFTLENLEKEALELLRNEDRRKAMQEAYSAIRSDLGTPGVSLRIAESIVAKTKE